MITRKKFITTQWEHYCWGILYIPDNILDKAPMVVFNHGTGESGNTEASTDKLYTHGPLSFIKSGWKPNFMILALQDSGWSPSPQSIKYVLDNDTEIKKKWNGTGIITGLSAGGQTTVDFMNAYDMPFSYVPMSPAGGGITTKKSKLWSFAGDSDGIFTEAAKKLAASTNGRLTIYKGGHGNWNTYYNPTYKENIDGKMLNIYEWGLNGVPSVPVPEIPVPPAPISKTIKKITIEYSTGEKVEIV